MSIPHAGFPAVQHTQQEQSKKQAWTELEHLLKRIHARHAHLPYEQILHDVEEAIRETRQHKRPSGR
jgi:hypothetical protein